MVGGWIYEPLLQRYYPVNVDADGSTRTVERDEITTLDGDDMGAATAVGS